MKIQRRSQLDKIEFQEEYLYKNKPVIVVDGMNNWQAKDLWTPEYFIKNFGNEKVQVYDDLFNLINVTSLSTYFEKYFNRPESPVSEVVPYVRWYTKFKECNFVWADEVFDKLQNEWSMPYFIPTTNYVMPYCAYPNEVFPTNTPFPARGLFISARGARTRLHYDPWASDAILCQMYGRKKISIYSPSQKEYLYDGKACVDIDNPNFEVFPKFELAKPDYEDILEPGEIILFPRGWLHHVVSISDSISLTWNFVHQSTCKSFVDYLIKGPSANELDVIKWFFKKNQD
jgi:hypothetical protein